MYDDSAEKWRDEDVFFSDLERLVHLCAASAFS